MSARERYLGQASLQERRKSPTRNQSANGKAKRYAVPLVRMASPRLSDIRMTHFGEPSRCDSRPKKTKQTSQKETTRSFWVLLDWRMAMGRVAARSAARSSPRLEAPNSPARADTPMRHPAMLNHCTRLARWSPPLSI